ncbi:FAD/NAD(P)-binding protein [Agrilactobacillus fermenti]|uniref:FAD/NAD(P)-binding protein n=1 Tax=Agrilactobacillus fermenti TaxID=2586909 RepID=UPI003A5C4CD0
MHIGIVGAGPRGLLILERLIAWSRERQEKMAIHLFDLNGIGGVVWQPNQSYTLIMNTPSNMISLFEDETVTPLAGPLTTGPNIYDWTKTEAAEYIQKNNQRFEHANAFLAEIKRLQANDYPTRALYGVYLNWYYERLTTQLPANVTLEFQLHNIIMVQRMATGQFTAQTLKQKYTFDSLIMALGYSENNRNEEEALLEDYANEHELVYIPPRNPASADLTGILPHSTVISRGLGLSFFDYVTLLTAGRGGTFTKNADQTLTYHPSGTEPKIVGMSRRGWPYHAKGINQKAYGEQFPAQYLTRDFLQRYDKAHPLPYEFFWQRLQLELNWVYYTLWLSAHQPEQVSAFQQAMKPLIQVAQLALILDTFKIPQAERLDIAEQMNPAVAFTENQIQQFTTAVASYLATDAVAAEAGTKTGPLTSALEMLRDVRDSIRYVIEHELLTEDEYINRFARHFNGVNNFLSIGPPVQRTRELQALVAAGVVEFAGPNARFSTDRGQFRLDSDLKPGQFWLADTILESRLPPATVLKTTNPLLTTLLANKDARSYQLQEANGNWVDTGAIEVDRQTDQLKDADGNVIKNLFMWGVPTEGLHWLTTMSPRPGVNDFFLQEADRIVATLFQNQTNS